ncbi:FtsW/RodA/SpoVE family cell cycle protein [Oscillibacter valericigenes]|uniref:permease prefix domain 1-containing protein n=1 Tax=Oscillibacter valericigenes TaxID=351091 RepID=UPI001F474CB7|nr:permease prefix domain 1-containing protein [Oscillibacter valericigenes]MCF2664641.1 FtsW/RodA/SpoVE family cell cycle protein [Oscillibacter valericigenes]
MADTIREYLDTVQEQIRWKRARPVVVRELEQHLTDQRDAFLEEGNTPETAERLAVEEMGDPVTIGTELDRVHRPKPQWGLLAATVALALLGGFLRVWLTASGADMYENISPFRTAIALALGTVCLLGAYFLDYTWLTRHARWVYIGALVLGVLSLWLSPLRNHAPYFTRYVVLLYPTVYAIWLYRCHGKGWKGIFLAIFGAVPLAAIGLQAPYLLGILLLVVTGFVLLLAAAGTDWFGVGRGKTAAAVLGLTGATAGSMVWQVWKNGWYQERLLMFLHPELDPLGNGYQAMSVRNALSVSQWVGMGNWSEIGSMFPFERSVPDWTLDFLPTTVIYKLGWLPFLLLVLAVAGLLVWLLWKCLRQKNQVGRLVALSVIVPLALQTVFSVMQNLGYILFSASMPLVTGNLPTVVTMGLIGLALSVFREEPIARENSLVHSSVSHIRMSLRNEKDVQNGDRVLGVSLVISRDGTKAAEGSSL